MKKQGKSILEKRAQKRAKAESSESLFAKPRKNQRLKLQRRPAHAFRRPTFLPRVGENNVSGMPLIGFANNLGAFRVNCSRRKIALRRIQLHA